MADNPSSVNSEANSVTRSSVSSGASSGERQAQLVASAEIKPAQPSQRTSWLERFQAIPIKFKLILIALLLSYAVAINVEQSRGSHRFVVELPQQANTGVEHYACLDKDAAIALQMRYEKQFAASNNPLVVKREKMNIVTKWLTCGVF